MKRSKKINPGIKTLAVLLRSGICNKISEMREVKMDITKTFLKRAGVGILTAFVVLLVSAVSWGDTAIYVYQTAGNGALTIKTITDTGTTATPVQTIPNSCYTPDLFWDSAAGALRLNGFHATNDPAWTGTINAAGVLANIMPPSLQPVNCSSATASIVSAAFPDNVPCTSYGAWTACTGGVMTRTGNPQGCAAAQLTTLPCTPACTSWGYTNWTPASCAAGSIQSRTATGSPAGCVGMPDAATVQSCPPQTCIYTYSTTLCGGTCTPTATGALTGTCPAAVTGVSPAGCTGGNTTPTTISCNSSLPPCTAANVTSWGACQPNSTQTPTGYASTCTPPATPPTRACTYTPPPTGNGTPLGYYAYNVHYTLPAGGTLLFNAAVASPNCTSSSRVSFGVSAQQQSPRTDILVKKSFNFTVPPPTKADYLTFFAQTGATAGQYFSITSNGSFFWNFSGSGSAETVLVMPANLTRSGVTNFNVLDTYYVLLVNTETGRSSDVYIQYYCY